jgi:hypothetical protein
MSVKHISAALAASALLASVAFAQTPTATTDRMAPSQMSSSLHGDAIETHSVVPGSRCLQRDQG